MVIAAVCTYAIAYRFYSRFIATRVFNSMTATRLPLSGSTTGATSSDEPLGRLRPPLRCNRRPRAADRPDPRRPVRVPAGDDLDPRGVVLAGAVQDFVILCASLRRGGRSLAKMAKDYLGRSARCRERSRSSS